MSSCRAARCGYRSCSVRCRGRRCRGSAIGNDVLTPLQLQHRHPSSLLRGYSPVVSVPASESAAWCRRYRRKRSSRKDLPAAPIDQAVSHLRGQKNTAGVRWSGAVDTRRAEDHGRIVPVRKAPATESMATRFLSGTCGTRERRRVCGTCAPCLCTAPGSPSAHTRVTTLSPDTCAYRAQTRCA